MSIIQTNVNEAIGSFNAIKEKIIESGVVIPEGTRPREYANKIEEVYEAGKKSMVDESKIIEKTVRGSVIAVDDVSEVPHDVAVQLSSDTVTDFSDVGVKVMGKNFWKFNSSYSLTGNGTNKALADSYDFDLPLEVYTFSCDVDIKDLTTSANGNVVYLGVIQKDGTTNYYTVVNHDSVSGRVVFTVDVSSSAINRFTLSLHNRCTGGTINITNIYLTASEGESYYIPNSNGSVAIKSISPYMTISTDIVDVNISATYHKSWGMQTEYDRFWDDFQDLGNRVLYNNAYQNAWSDLTFKPKYTMRPTSAGYMFAGTKIADIKGCLERCGKELDLSNATSIDRLFSDAPNLTRIPKISTVSAPHLQNFVYNCKNLISIEEIVLKEDGSQTFNDNSFKNCEALVEIRFSGKIGNNINLSWSKNLSMESLASIVAALSTSVSGKTITLPTTAEQTYDNVTFGGRWNELIEPYRAYWSFAYA